jgi:hypothetical protein
MITSPLTTTSQLSQYVIRTANRSKASKGGEKIMSQERVSTLIEDYSVCVLYNPRAISIRL